MFELFQLAWIVLVDAALSFDNAILISARANALPEAERETAKVYGILGAVVARIVFAFFGTWLLRYAAFTVVGGLYLLWVSWDMLRKHGQPEAEAPKWWEKMFGPVPQIILADVMMSGDNVLAIAHTARGNLWLMVFGIVLSIGLMFYAARWVSRVIAWEPVVLGWKPELFGWRPQMFHLAVLVVALTGANMTWIGFWTKV